MAKTHYEALGVKPTATPQEIKSAYRKLVLKHHPDRSKDPNSKAVFLRVTEAYEVLNDESQRRMYDEQLDLAEQRKAQIAAEKKAAAERPPPSSSQPPRAARSAVQQPPTITVELSRLTLLYNRGRYAEAERLARVILQRDSRQAIPYAVLGDLCRARGDLDEAQRMYAYATQMDPRNPVYQRRYEQLLASSRIQSGSKRIHLESERTNLGMPLVAASMVVASAIYISASAEAAMLASVGLISTWTLGVLILLFLCGVISGACLAIGNFLDRFEAANTTSTGRFGPTVVLGLIAVVNFWAAALVYALIGLSQRAFNYSTSRMVVAVAAVVLMLSFGAQIGGQVDPRQVFLWGGNLAYLGALVGWLVADAFKGTL